MKVERGTGAFLRGKVLYFCARTSDVRCLEPPLRQDNDTKVNRYSRKASCTPRSIPMWRERRKHLLKSQRLGLSLTPPRDPYHCTRVLRGQ